MKLLCLFTFIIVAGAILAQSPDDGKNEGFEDTGVELKTPMEKRTVVRRVLRSTFSGMSEQFFVRTEATIISNCKLNGHQRANSLQDTYSEMESCLRKKRIFIAPKDEFLANVEECSKDAVAETKACLGEKQKYFPEFVLELVKSVTNFMYDDREYMRDDIAPCLPRLNGYRVQRDYIQCLTDASTQHHDTNQIPESKAAFCKAFIPASYCFTNMLKETCDRTTGLDQFREDYINAMKRPCESKENPKEQ